MTQWSMYKIQGNPPTPTVPSPHTQKCQTPTRNNLELMSEFSKVTVYKAAGHNIIIENQLYFHTYYLLTCVSQNLKYIT